jgi:DNA-binding NarL/FixJ family response regulator
VPRGVENGIPTAEIASHISLSSATVRHCLSNSISKADARNRIDAIRSCRNCGWL